MGYFGVDRAVPNVIRLFLFYVDSTKDIRQYDVTQNTLLGATLVGMTLVRVGVGKVLLPRILCSTNVLLT